MNGLRNWNETVQPDDEIYILGDFTMRKKSCAYMVYFTRVPGECAKKEVIGSGYIAF